MERFIGKLRPFEGLIEKSEEVQKSTERHPPSASANTQGEVMSHHEVTQKVAKQRDISRLSLYGKKPLDPLILIGLRCCTAELSPARLISGI